MTDILTSSSSLLYGRQSRKMEANQGLVTIFVRNYSKKAIKLRMKPSADVMQLREKVFNKMGVKVEDQAIFLQGKLIQNEINSIQLLDGLIFHLVNIKRVSVPEISFHLHRIQPGSMVHKVTVNPQVQISYFIKNIFSKKYENPENYFLVYLGKQLQMNKTFQQQYVEDGCQILVIHKMQNLKNQNVQIKKQNSFLKGKAPAQVNKNSNLDHNQSKFPQQQKSVKQSKQKNNININITTPTKTNQNPLHHDQSIQQQVNIPNELYQTAKFNQPEQSSPKDKNKDNGNGNGNCNGNEGDMEETEQIVIGNNNALSYISEKTNLEQQAKMENQHTPNKETFTMYGLVPKKKISEFNRETSSKGPIIDSDPAQIVAKTDPDQPTPIKPHQQPPQQPSAPTYTINLLPQQATPLLTSVLNFNLLRADNHIDPQTDMKGSYTNSFSNIQMTIKTISSRYGDEMNASVKQRIQEEMYLDGASGDYSESIIYVDQKDSFMRSHSNTNGNNTNSKSSGENRGDGDERNDKGEKEYDNILDSKVLVDEDDKVEEDMTASKVATMRKRKKPQQDLSKLSRQSSQSQNSKKQKQVSQTIDPIFLQFRKSKQQDEKSSQEMGRSEGKSLQNRKIANVKIINNIGKDQPRDSKQMEKGQDQNLSGVTDSVEGVKGRSSSQKASRFKMKRTMSFQLQSEQKENMQAVDEIKQAIQQNNKATPLFDNPLCTSEVQPFDPISSSSSKSQKPPSFSGNQPQTDILTMTTTRKYPNISNISETNSVDHESYNENENVSGSRHGEGEEMLISRFGWGHKFPFRQSFTSNVDQSSVTDHNEQNFSIGTIQSHTYVSKQSRESQFQLDLSVKRSNSNPSNSISHTGSEEVKDTIAENFQISGIMVKSNKNKNKYQEIDSIGEEVLETGEDAGVKGHGNGNVIPNFSLESLRYSVNKSGSGSGPLQQCDASPVQTKESDRGAKNSLKTLLKQPQPLPQINSQQNLLEDSSCNQLQDPAHNQNLNQKPEQLLVNTSLNKEVKNQDSLLLEGSAHKIQSSQNLLDQSQSATIKKIQEDNDNLLNYVGDSGEKFIRKKDVPHFDSLYDNMGFRSELFQRTGQTGSSFQFVLVEGPAIPSKLALKAGDLLMLASTADLNLCQKQQEQVTSSMKNLQEDNIVDTIRADILHQFYQLQPHITTIQQPKFEINPPGASVDKSNKQEQQNLLLNYL